MSGKHTPGRAMKAEELARRMCCCRTTEETFGAPEPHGCTLALPYAAALLEMSDRLRVTTHEPHCARKTMFSDPDSCTCGLMSLLAKADALIGPLKGEERR